MCCKLDFALNFSGFDYRFVVICCFRMGNIAKKFKSSRPYCCFSLSNTCVLVLVISFLEPN